MTEIDMMGIVWGRSKRSRKMHYYKDGEALCGWAGKLEITSPSWNEGDPRTCRACQNQLNWWSLHDNYNNRPLCFCPNRSCNGKLRPHGTVNRFTKYPDLICNECRAIYRFEKLDV